MKLFSILIVLFLIGCFRVDSVEVSRYYLDKKRDLIKYQCGPVSSSLSGSKFVIRTEDEHGKLVTYCLIEFRGNRKLPVIRLDDYELDTLTRYLEIKKMVKK